jgi:RnfABCDGE-type electron transport complex B subunit
MEILIPIAVIAGLALLLGIGLSIASKVFHVARDPRIDTVREALPGANCGACGYSGCDGYAEAIATGEAGITLCPVGGAPLVKVLGGIMGIEAEEAVGKQAVVLCQGDWNTVDMKYKYEGIQDCASAAALLGGMSACIFGCLGLGSCQRVCKFDAIVVENGLARILPDKCTGCGACVAECPKGIIKMLPVNTEHTVLCSNHERGAVSRKNCRTACIACGLCVRNCPVNAIKMENSLAVIDPALCIDCGKCAEVCPQHTILAVQGGRLRDKGA